MHNTTIDIYDNLYLYKFMLRISCRILWNASHGWCQAGTTSHGFNSYETESPLRNTTVSSLCPTPRQLHPDIDHPPTLPPRDRPPCMYITTPKAEQASISEWTGLPYNSQYVHKQGSLCCPVFIAHEQMLFILAWYRTLQYVILGL